MTEETAQTGDATGANSQNSGAVKVEFSPEQQAHIDRIISERLGRAQEQWQVKQAEAVKAAEEAAELKRLEENNEYKTLYEKAKAEAQSLHAEKIKGQQVAGALGEYQQTIAELLTTRINALGETAKIAVDNLPGNPDALEKLRWLNKNENLFTNNATVSKPGGTPPRNRGLTFQPQQQQAATNQPPIIKL